MPCVYFLSFYVLFFIFMFKFISFFQYETLAMFFISYWGSCQGNTIRPLLFESSVIFRF